MGSCFLVTQTPTVTLLVAYSNKHTTQGQGISHHHLPHNKTQKYHSGHSASSVPSPKSTHSPTQEHTHTHMYDETIISIAFTHPHIQAAIPQTQQRPHLQTLATPHPDALHGLPQLVERGHSLGEAQSFLHLAVNGIYSASAARWEVHGGRSVQPVCRSTVQKWQERAANYFHRFMNKHSLIFYVRLTLKKKKKTSRRRAVFCPPCPFL